jgi:hypothetical protein
MKILMLTMDDNGSMGVTIGEGVSPTLGLHMCEAAEKLFRDKIVDDEVERRVAALTEVELEESDAV